MHLELYAWTPPGVGAIPLRRRNGSIRAFAWVDEEDVELLSFTTWSLHPHGYVVRTVGPKNNQYTFRMHRLVLGLRDDDPRQADHVNGCRRDNRKGNLRAVEERHNHQNLAARANGTSRYRGVCWDAGRNKWRAEGTVGGKRAHLGYYVSELEAHRAVSAWRAANMPYSNEARSAA